MLKKYFLLVIFFLIVTAASAQNNSLRVARIFSDNMVMQQQIYAPVWGWDKPGENIEVSFAGKKYTTQADQTGKWLIRINPTEAGGPYEMTITNDAKSTQVFKNVMIGEVWLASGQSNMNYGLGSVNNAGEVLKEANYPNIREFRTPNDVSRLPKEDLSGGQWVVCSPQTASGFSGVAYFFARSLHLDKKVPVGIIHTSCSGTICEAWISADILYTIPEFKNRVIEEIYKSDKDWQKLHNEAIEKDKERENIFVNINNGVKQGVNKPNFKDSSWKEAEYPLYPARVGLGGYVMVWLRKSIEIPASATGKDLKLDLGKVMTGDITYFNGQEVGRERWDGYRVYNIPGKLVKAGKNVIAIRLLSEWGNGRLGDEISDPYIYSDDKNIHISLKGPWKYNGEIEPELPVGRGYTNDISSMFNTKINPLIPYGLRGFLWYQGEGNSGRPKQYEVLQPAMFTDWRVRFQQGYLPFIFVQLPNIEGGACQYFRESQAKSLVYPNTAMAVSIDAGDPYDIHPANKKPVGERMYLAAKKLVYGDNIVSSGPVLESSEIKENTIILTFSNTGSGLISKDGLPLRTFEISADNEHFVPAKAIIQGDKIIVSDSNIKNPVAVRHAWSSNPDLNLYNKEGLPATSFRTKE